MFRKLKNIYHLLQAVIANFLYGSPGKKLTVIGVTGTDGKSTVCNLIFHILRAHGKKAGVISTVGAKINDEDFGIGLHTTTPTSFALQKLLKEMLKRKCEFAVIEVASHGIDQKRIWGIPFKIGILTNVTREHLDYHKNFREYEKVKLDFLKTCEMRVINGNYKKFSEAFKKDNKRTVTYGINLGDIRAVDVKNNEFTLLPGAFIIRHNLLGDFNIENILASFAACDLLHVSREEIIKGIGSFQTVKGRLEIIPNNRNLHIFVDFAHTPNAVDQVLTTLRKEFPNARIIHVFGATGKRDKEKRPLMGEISGRLADISILTKEDTYGENAISIIEMIEEGIKKTKIKNESYFIEQERYKALEKAVNLARENDVIVATGVGHQTTLNIGHEVEWSDQEEMRKILAKTVHSS